MLVKAKKNLSALYKSYMYQAWFIIYYLINPHRTILQERKLRQQKAKGLGQDCTAWGDFSIYLTTPPVGIT